MQHFSANFLCSWLVLLFPFPYLGSFYFVFVGGSAWISTPYTATRTTRTTASNPSFGGTKTAEEDKFEMVISTRRSARIASQELQRGMMGGRTTGSAKVQAPLSSSLKATRKSQSGDSSKLSQVKPTPTKRSRSGTRRKADETAISPQAASRVSSSPPTSPLPSSSSLLQLTSAQVAAINPTQPYIDLKVPPSELRPSATLTTGQCFHWQAVQQQERVPVTTTPTPSTSSSTSAWGSHNATEWVGTLRVSKSNSIVVAIRETPESTFYRPLTTSSSSPSSSFDLNEYFSTYFQLRYNLTNLYDAWSKADSRLSTIAKCIPGVRIIDQDPWECLISFICSSNNNIPRITKMLTSIRREYGKPLITIGEQTLYSFPSCNDIIQKATDEHLRQACGLGYRSKYVLETAKLLHSLGGEEYLHQLRQMDDDYFGNTKEEEDDDGHDDDNETVQEKLCQFCGVGRKVADCVGLFSLQQHAAIPVDVHVWNIARRDYDDDNSSDDENTGKIDKSSKSKSLSLSSAKSLTPTIYKQVGDIFRTRFDTMAGWAHSLLFIAELPSFRPVLPSDIVEEMDNFRKEEQLRKKQKEKTKGTPQKSSSSSTTTSKRGRKR